MPVRAILFDKDGTLLDFDLTWNEAFIAVVTELARGDDALIERICDYSGYDRASRRVRPDAVFIAASGADYGRVWADIIGVPADQAFFSHMNERFHHHSAAFLTPIGDPAALCEDLERRGYALGMVTNDSERGARAHAEALGIARHMPDLIGYDSGFGRKPAPGQILGYLDRRGFAAADVVMVGDTLHDLHAARAAGVIGVAVLSGHADESILGPHADHVITDIMALPDLLERL